MISSEIPTRWLRRCNSVVIGLCTLPLLDATLSHQWLAVPFLLWVLRGAWRTRGAVITLEMDEAA